MRNKRYRNGFALTLHPDKLADLIHWRKLRRVFVNSMSDLFYEDIPLDFIRQVFITMKACPQHQFQALVKSPWNVIAKQYHIHSLDNVWIGVSVEDNSSYHRIRTLQNVDARIRFVSLEPLIGPFNDLGDFLEGIH